MSNSSLVNYTKLTNNKGIWNDNGTYWGDRTGPISKITVHHMAANASIESVGEQFANPSRGGSSNYGIGTDGRIALYVEEKYRAWTSGSVQNDGIAVTIEVANDGGKPNWHVSDKAFNSLIKLCADICKRNGIKKLIWTGDASGNLTTHDMFQATTCPGPYLKSRLGELADEVNKILNGQNKVENTVKTNPYKEPTRTIQYYTTGEDVKWIQWSLKNCGYSVSIDGSFGPDSLNKTKQFQKDRGLTANGIVDATVRDYLKNPNNPKFTINDSISISFLFLLFSVFFSINPFV